MDRPSHGWSTECEITRVVDGDTVEIRVERIIRVRLLDCWAVEIKGDSEPDGLTSKRNLQSIAEGKHGTLFVPTEEARSFQDILTLGRILGHVWVDGSEIELSQHQVTGGFATKEKPK